jgi:hypothetical protein
LSLPSSHRLVRLAPRPVFDSAQLVRTAQTGPLVPEDIAALERLWPATLGALHAWRIDAGPSAWLLLWLDEALEREVERRFAQAPAQGFLEHALAVHCVMAAAATQVPELAEHGCAPVPAPHPAITAAVKELGLSWPERDTLCRRYALLTGTPFSGGCSGCALGPRCPRLKTPT